MRGISIDTLYKLCTQTIKRYAKKKERKTHTIMWGNFRFVPKNTWVTMVELKTHSLLILQLPKCNWKWVFVRVICVLVEYDGANLWHVRTFVSSTMTDTRDLLWFWWKISDHIQTNAYRVFSQNQQRFSNFCLQWEKKN